MNFRESRKITKFSISQKNTKFKKLTLKTNKCSQDRVFKKNAGKMLINFIVKVKVFSLNSRFFGIQFVFDLKRLRILELNHYLIFYFQTLLIKMQLMIHS